MRISGRYKEFCTSKFYHIRSYVQCGVEVEADAETDFDLNPNPNPNAKSTLP